MICCRVAVIDTLGHEFVKYRRKRFRAVKYRGKGFGIVECRGGYVPKRAVGPVPRAHLQMQGPALIYGCEATGENASEKKHEQ
jgi:hypothetical protein